MELRELEFDPVVSKCEVCGEVMERKLYYGVSEDYPEDVYMACGGDCENWEEGSTPLASFTFLGKE